MLLWASLMAQHLQDKESLEEVSVQASSLAPFCQSTTPTWAWWVLTLVGRFFTGTQGSTSNTSVAGPNGIVIYDDVLYLVNQNAGKACSSLLSWREVIA